MAKVRTFRDLVAWQKGMTLAKAIYMATRQMPTDERYGVTSQMRRAAVSIPSNIAEGHGRQSRADYLKHLRIARGPLAELMTQYELATDMMMIESATKIVEQLNETDRVLQGLIRSLENKSRAE
jgi:four helix bundle protein